MDEENNQQGVGQDVPTEDTPASEPETTQENVQDQQNADQAPEQDDEFPEDAQAQRKAFIAMRKEIKELKSKSQAQQETKDSYDQYEDDVDPIDLARGTIRSRQTDYGQQAQPTNQPTEFDNADPATRAFLEKASSAEERAKLAEQRATEANAQLEDFEAWQKYPFLNPRQKASRDEDQQLFVEEVQNSYMAARVRALQQGKRLPRLVDVADQVQTRIDRIRGRGSQLGAEEARREIASKESATVESRGTTTSITEQSNQERVEELRKRVHMGDVNALTELNKLTDPYIQGLE